MSDAPDKKATPLKDFYAADKGPSIEIHDIDDILESAEPAKSQEKGKKKKSGFKFKKAKNSQPREEIIENDETVFEKERLKREAEATVELATNKGRIDLEEAIVKSQQKTDMEDKPESDIPEESKENDGKSTNCAKDSPSKKPGTDKKSSVEKIDSTTKSHDGASAKKKQGKKVKIAENQSKLSFFTKPAAATKTNPSTRQSKRQKTGE